MLIVRIRNARQDCQVPLDGSAIEVGRAPAAGEGGRLVVDDPYTSRRHLRLAALPSGQLQVTVLGRAVTLADGQRLVTGSSEVLSVPQTLRIGHSSIDVFADSLDRSSDPASTDLRTLHLPPDASSPREWISRFGGSPPAETLAAWFETLLDVQHSALDSDAFHSGTARAVVELVGLDRGLVLLRHGREWQVAAEYCPHGKAGHRFSRRVLMYVDQHRRTFYQSFDDGGSEHSLVDVDAVVASPIRGSTGAVIGVVYGSRDLRSGADTLGIHPLEAQVVQLLAASVSAGLARAQRQAEAARHRVLLEQFASPQIARALESDPTLFDGRERDISILFCDLRGYSALAERLGARMSYRLLAAVMDRLTEHVLEQSGVIIDYYGDGLAAMWNAPIDQPDHAVRAACCARAMLDALPALNVEWAAVLGQPLSLSVGMHSGTAQVGNAGSQRRVKYGPRGHTVNLAARVEQLTRTLDVEVLLTGSTHQQLPAGMPVRRICRALIAGLEQPTDLFELGPRADRHWQTNAGVYQEALRLHEAGQWQASTEALRPLLSARDGPARWLAARNASRIDAGATDPPTPWPLT